MQRLLIVDDAIYGLMRLTNAIYCTGIKTD